MSRQNIFRKTAFNLLRKILSVKEDKNFKLNHLKNVLIVRQHNQFGDLLASVSLFRAFKESYPDCKITLIASPENYFAIEKNEYVDHLFVFNKRKIFSPDYFTKLTRILRQKYDVAVVPATVAVSKTSCILAALSKSKKKIGPASLNGEPNPMAFVFHYRINLDWKKCPDAHVSDFIQDIIRPIGVSTKDFTSSILIEQSDKDFAREFLDSLEIKPDEYLIGFHIGAGKPQNRWPLEKFIKLIYLIEKDFKIKLFFTGTEADKSEIDYIQSNLNIDAGYFLNKSIPQLAALISESDLFITNDTGVMHVAGAVKTPQISIFGPTNPFNWAPVGKEKYFVRKSELIADVQGEEILNLVNIIFENHKKI